MLLYQKLLMQELENTTYRQLAISMKVPLISMHDWATYDFKKPQYKSLERMAEYFRVPLPTLLMETKEDIATTDEHIVKLLFNLTETQKQDVLNFIKKLLPL